MKNTFSTIQKFKARPNYWDIIALMLILAIIILFAWSSMQMSKPYHLGLPTPISLDPSHLPLYALLTVWRMMIAMMISLLFTFVFGTWAARSPYAERLIIPVVDVMQSIPVLSFLSITVVGFIELFPNSMLGPECAVIFVIFTAQAWNMVLGFYQSLRTVPGDLMEAADMFHLSAWQRFWRIEVPFAMPSLLWNMMMSMSASWFFLVASEAVTVANQTITVPGIGSYIAIAIAKANGHAVAYAILTMVIVILLYDQLLFRPLVAWSEKFRIDQTGYEQQSRSWVITLFQRTKILSMITEAIGGFFNACINFPLFRRKKSRFSGEIIYPRVHYWINHLWNFILVLLVMVTAYILCRFVFKSVSLHNAAYACLLGLFTATRVLVLIVFCTLFWVPIGVWIGFRPKATAIAQPLIQFLAAFPANLLFPIVVFVIVYYHLNVNVWTTPLMILGTQWYVLFNVIAGASALPKEIIHAADNFGVRGWLRWWRVILPGIFPYYITGAMTAAGGAWNASLVAEVVTWGHTHLVAKGIGAYITQYTNEGDFPRIALGTGILCVYVLVLNRLVWRPLYLYAERRFRLD